MLILPLVDAKYMKLTQKQESFCVKYVETGNAAEAYRQSYDAAGMTDNSIYVAACKLLDNPKVAQRLEEIRKPALEKAQLTLEQHLDDLRRLRDLAEASEKYGPAIQAEVARGKASGLYIEKVEANVTGNVVIQATPIDERI